MLTVLSAITALLSGYLSFLAATHMRYTFVDSKRIPSRGAGFVVVLGSGLRAGGRVPPLLASRLERGRAVYERLVSRGTTDPVLIVSGGKAGGERVSEAEAMARYLIERGFPADRVVLEDRSRTTEENIRFSKAIMDQSRPGARCVIVTSNYHAFRAAIIARRAGLSAQVTGAATAGGYLPSAMLREFGAVILGHKRIDFGSYALIVALRWPAPSAQSASRPESPSLRSE